MSFDSWQRWGVDLDDVSFARAWCALGVAVEKKGMRSVDDLHQATWGHSPIEWRFPPAPNRTEGTPAEWAEAWELVPKRVSGPVRLRVFDAPPDEPLCPWFRVLKEAQPAPQSVSLGLPAGRGEPGVGWPLRFGTLPGAPCRALERLEAMWPANRLARTMRLDRANARCDFLLFPGIARTMLHELLNTRWDLKANVVVLRGGNEAEWGEIQGWLAAILARTSASGFVLVPASLGDEAWPTLLNEMVRELSHAKQLDLAIAEVFETKSAGDVVAGFGGEIIEFVVRDLADRCKARLAALPPGTLVDLSQVGHPTEWLAPGMQARGFNGGEPKDSIPLPPDADCGVAANDVSVEPQRFLFGHEGEGSSTLVQLVAAVEGAKPPAEATQARAARFLQQRSFVRQKNLYQEAKDGFIVGVPTLVRVRIAAPEEGWNALPTEFPVEELPPHLEKWTLTVWLTEPDHLPVPIRGRIELPRDGNSTECDLRFRPRQSPEFEGRITVLHRGRVIQTALLRAAVRKPEAPPVADGTPRLECHVAVHHGLGNLHGRRQYDLAFVANHDSKGRPLLTAVSAKAAWVKDLSTMPSFAAEINKTLSPVAKSVQDYATGLDGEKGRALFVQLAQHGGALKTFLNVTLEDPENHPAAAAADYVQIVSTRPDAVVPLEFVYDHVVPEDDAKVCSMWREAMAGKCPAGCPSPSEHCVCPLGFWGLRKVIERHAVRPGLAKDGNILYLQSETTAERDTLYVGGAAVLGGSRRIPAASVDELAHVLAEHCGAQPGIAKSWDKWEELVKDLHPSLLVALPHTDGKNTNVSVEIGDGKDVKTITLRETHVFPPPVAGHQPPLVALIGCDTAGTADDYGNHVLVLRDRGAAIVIGTIATVFGEHAASVAGRLVQGILPKGGTQPVRLGELMLAIRRDSLRDGLLMPLCLVAFGDADWIISRRP
jgi:hypothetical protein